MGQVEIGTGLIVLFVILGICIIAFKVYAIRWVIMAHRRKVASGREGLIGRMAVVKEVLNPKGMVFIRGERWMAESEEGRITLGEEVIINKVDSLKLYVSKRK